MLDAQSAFDPAEEKPQDLISVFDPVFPDVLCQYDDYFANSQRQTRHDHSVYQRWKYCNCILRLFVCQLQEPRSAEANHR